MPLSLTGYLKPWDGEYLGRKVGISLNNRY